jgi:hypothetical protein
MVGSAGVASAHGHEHHEHGRGHSVHRLRISETTVYRIPSRHGAIADGAAIGSPGVLSGNVIQVPVSIPVNVCGNTINVVGILNPAAGNTCLNR